MVLPPSEEAVAPFVIHDLGIEKGEHLKRICQAWKKADAVVQRLKEQGGKYLKIAGHAEKFASQHKYTIHLRSKSMESKVEALEQQNQDLRGEVGQLREQMAQMFQILTQTNAAVTALANQSAVGYAQVNYASRPPPRNVRDPPYGMLHGWNTKSPANEEQEQQNAVNNRPVFNASSGAGPTEGAGPNTKEDPEPNTRHRGMLPPL
ncbi:hypothetical protein CR513_05667, partial [Mucuna pruriens]